MQKQRYRRHTEEIESEAHREAHREAHVEGAE